jgi:hypothetical protein
MNPTIWKLATLNVKRINNASKYDDIMEWIMENNIDATILTETKINQINANFKFKKYQKNYKSLWTLDDGAPKGSGVGLIIKKNTIGKHIYHRENLKGRAINIKLKLKGKIDISITGLYGPADHSDKETKEKTIKFIDKHILTSPSKYNIIAGDFNEDPFQHENTPIIELITNKSLCNIPLNDENEAYTWHNSSGTKRLLDHIYMSHNLLDIKGFAEIKYTSSTLQTDHEALINTIDISMLTNSQGPAVRRQRRKKNQAEQIIDSRKNTTSHWICYGPFLVATSSL